MNVLPYNKEGEFKLITLPPGTPVVEVIRALELCILAGNGWLIFDEEEVSFLKAMARIFVSNSQNRKLEEVLQRLAEVNYSEGPDDVPCTPPSVMWVVVQDDQIFENPSPDEYKGRTRYLALRFNKWP